MKKQKPYWEMSTAELAEATRMYDDPNYEPRAVKMTPRQRLQLRQFRQWQRKHAHHSRLTLMLHPKLVEQADSYAEAHGLTITDVVSDALRQWVGKKSA